MQKKLFINELQIGQEVELPLAIYEKRLNQFVNKSGQASSALMLTIGDKTGKIAAVLWDNVKEYNALWAIDRVYLFKGRVGEYRGQPQLVINSSVALAADQYQLTDYVAGAPFDRDAVWRRMLDVMRSIASPHLRTLLGNIFDANTRRKFMTAPGGREVHHAYVGGLLEHTMEVVAYAEAMLEEQGSHLNRDLLITGCILHDIGKLEEYDLNSLSFQMTDRGKLLGHLQMGAKLVAAEVANIAGFPLELGLELEHMLLSHHGLPEWGAVQQPKTINAMALHLADVTSGRLSQFSGIMAGHDADSGQWSNWDKFLARSVYVPTQQQIIKKPEANETGQYQERFL